MSVLEQMMIVAACAPAVFVGLVAFVVMRAEHRARRRYGAAR